MAGARAERGTPAGREGWERGSRRAEAPKAAKPAGKPASEGTPLLPAQRSAGAAGPSGDWRGEADAWLRDRLQRLKPPGLEGFGRATLVSDVLAGCAVGLMGVPQVVAYMTMAGLPAHYGLYACLAGGAYAAFGSCYCLSVGPSAVLSLLLREGLKRTVPSEEEDGGPKYRQAAIQITLLCGVLQMAFWILRLGWLTSLLSHSVILGFTHGSSVIIGLSQLRLWFGIHSHAGSTLQDLLHMYWAEGQLLWQPLAMGAVCLVVLLIFKHLGKTYKHLHLLRPLGPAFVAVAATFFCWALEPQNVTQVGHIPSGLPPLAVSRWFPMEDFTSLLSVAATVASVGMIESISIARSVAPGVEPEREIFAVGFINLVAALFPSCASTGSFGRTAVSHDAGSRTSFSAVCTALFFLLTLLTLTEPLSYMPLNALASIVISSVLGLFTWREALVLWRVNKKDFVVWFMSFAGTLLLGAELGLLLAVGVHILMVLHGSAFPHLSVLGHIRGTTVYRNVLQYPEAEEVPNFLIVRVDAPIYFANCTYVWGEIAALVAEKPVRNLVLEFAPVARVDTHGALEFKGFIRKMAAAGVGISLSNASSKVLRALDRSGALPEGDSEVRVFARVQDAVVCLSEEAGEAPHSPSMAADGHQCISVPSPLKIPKPGSWTTLFGAGSRTPSPRRGSEGLLRDPGAGP